MRHNNKRTVSIRYRYLTLFTLLVLLVTSGYVHADEPPSIPANIHGTVTVNGIPVTGSGYTVSGGGVQSGLDGSGEYLLTIPAGGSGYLSVLKNGAPLTVTNGYFSVTGGDDIWIDLQAIDIPVTFSATPKSITEGEFTTLFWSISNADYASIDNGIGDINPQSGSIEVSPLSTTTYTLTAGNAAGSVTRSVKVTEVIPENHSYHIPYYRGDTEYCTALALRNSSDTQVANVTVTIYDQDGTVIESEVLDPALSADGQYAYVLRRDFHTEGWIRVDSDQKLTGFSWTARVGETSQRMVNMADVTLIPELSTALIIPHVAQDDNWDTTVYISNPNNSRTTVTLTYVDQSGVALYTKDYSIPANGSGAYELSDLLGGEQAHNGSVRIAANRGVAAFALYYDTEKQSGSCYAGVNAVDPSK